jgi:hypothetical protein
MALAILLAAGLAWWLHQRGELLPNLLRWAGTGAIALVAVKMLETGRPLLALVAAGIAWGWWRTQAPKAAGPGRAGDEAAALALLKLRPGADADAVHAAWRRAMQAAHPDGGGSDAAARAVTAARDLLLARAVR